jgi:hypothetical protein
METELKGEKGDWYKKLNYSLEYEKMQKCNVVVFRVMIARNLLGGYRYFGGECSLNFYGRSKKYYSTFLRNVGTHLTEHTTSQSKGQQYCHVIELP